MAKWEDEAGHGVKEWLFAGANFFTVMVPFFGVLGFGIAKDKIQNAKDRRKKA